MTLNWNYCMSFSCLRSTNIIKMFAYFVAFLKLYRWYALKMPSIASSFHFSFWGSDKYTFTNVENISRKLFNFFSFLFDFFSLERFTEAPSENIYFVILAAILYSWSHFCGVANRVTLKYKEKYSFSAIFQKKKKNSLIKNKWNCVTQI